MMEIHLKWMRKRWFYQVFRNNHTNLIEFPGSQASGFAPATIRRPSPVDTGISI